MATLVSPGVSISVGNETWEPPFVHSLAFRCAAIGRPDLFPLLADTKWMNEMDIETYDNVMEQTRRLLETLK